MALCVTHNVVFDPQWEWCPYCGKPDRFSANESPATVRPVGPTNTRMEQGSEDQICPRCKGSGTTYEFHRFGEVCGKCGGTGKLRHA